MQVQPFRLERYFARHEFSARHLLSSSDCESLSLAELVAGADDECRSLWQGLPLLRQEIAALYGGRAGADGGGATPAAPTSRVTADDVLEVVPEEGILLTMIALLEPGDHVIATWPGYQSLFGIAEQLGCEVTYWQPDEAQGWRFDPAFVRAALRPSTRLVVINFPHNPTGALPPAADVEEVIGLVAEAGIHLFSDEMYRWLEQEPAGRLPAAVERYEKAVTLCGLSKTFSLPGLRVGWLTTRDPELLNRLAAARDYSTICASAPSEVLALMGLRDRVRIVAANRARIAANSDSLEALMAAHPDLISWTRPRAGSVGLARLSVAEGALAFCERLVAETGVMLVPSTVFGYGDAHVRVGLGRADFAEGLAALQEWLSRR